MAVAEDRRVTNSQVSLVAPLTLVVVRIGLIWVLLASAYLLFRSRGLPDALPLAGTTSTYAVTVANVITLALLAWLVRRDGSRLRDLLGFERARLASDVGWGVLWLVVFWAVFLVPLTLVPLGLARPGSASEVQAAYEQVFSGMYADLVTTDALPAWSGVLVGIVFPFLNAPVEELTYRGYVQAHLVRRTGSAAFGIAVTALAFGIQHLAFAASWPGALTYAVAFTGWGLAAGIVYHRRGRLMPLVVAHVLTNLPFGLLPVAFTLAG
ncbi:CPBP family intramembrane glutamic endopeptidase [Thermasporomyces composti]|jgi:membrane protease YdiL (CAAX protease family)|uniref:CAAX prenyl protease 2/Lysostaphin resistance protein A-like domain-containing protein n=1 Tax=Thermasporomyces composti TaxID=696763 RepID=A0A3D9V5B3_THECX|nr:type II CAAX endopeptidase family protein [Thermasporomyces composti]REF35350.1 hypothetical protein DFJ64_0729 [Thermasporomyces composti]